MQNGRIRVRWEWLQRTDIQRPWQGIPMMVDKEARQSLIVWSKLRWGMITTSYFGEIAGSMVDRLLMLLL